MIKIIKDILRPFKRRFNTIIHHGNRVTCNCCGHSFRSFRYLGHGEKTTGACWYCNSYPRTRMIKEYLENNFDNTIGRGKILHIAPEIPIYNWLRGLSGITYTAGDKHATGYNYPQGVINIDVTELPFETDSFDLVICNHVMEHVKSDIKAMREIFRVLRPGAIAILLAPLDKNLEHSIEEPERTTMSPEEREKVFGQFDHVRIYGTDYYDRLRIAGFETDIIPPREASIAKYGLFPYEDMVICKKPRLSTFCRPSQPC